MKKNLKRVLCLVMALVLTASLSVSAFASAPYGKYLKFDSIFSIGDSTTSGYKLEGYKNWNAPEGYLHGLNGSYSRTVAEALGLGDELDVLAYPGFRSKDALMFLGGDVEPDEYFDLSYKGRMSHASCDSGAEVLAETAEKFDVTTGVGPNFINKLASGENKLVLLYGGAADVFYATTYMTTDGGHVNMNEDILGALEYYTATLWNSYYDFLNSYPALIQKIREINPNATLVMLGTFNPLENVILSDELAFQIGDLFALLSTLINETVKTYAEMYDGIYVDISGTETYTLENGYSIGDLTGNDDIFHPNQEGYDYIARQILKALEVCRPVTTNISVDLGSVKSVSSVMVDKTPVSLYHFDSESHTLTVPCLLTNAKTLTVTSVREDGSVYVAVYLLDWTLQDGYTAHILYNNKDIIKTVINLVKTVFSLADKLKAAFASADVQQIQTSFKII